MAPPAQLSAVAGGQLRDLLGVPEPGTVAVLALDHRVGAGHYQVVVALVAGSAVLPALVLDRNALPLADIGLPVEVVREAPVAPKVCRQILAAGDEQDDHKNNHDDEWSPEMIPPEPVPHGLRDRHWHVHSI